MRWVVDASVAAKWLTPEPDAQAAAALLDDDLFAPDLLYVEVGNILWKKQQRGEVESAVAALAVRWLKQVPLQVHDGVSLLADAVGLAIRLGHPVYDCCYVALARRLGVPLVTADRRLVRRCGADDAANLKGTVRLLASA